MADNTVIPPATGGDTIRTIDRSLDTPAGTSKTQVVQLDAGGESAESLVTSATPLPVINQRMMDTLEAILLELRTISQLLVQLNQPTIDDPEKVRADFNTLIQ